MKSTFKASTAKTIHVDFGTKQMVKVEEMEYVGQSIRSSQESQAAFQTMAFGSYQTDEGTGLGGFSGGIQIDPARYIESVIQRFEEICDTQGLFDEDSYSNPHVAFDASETVKILDREIAMLNDVKANLQDLLNLRKPSRK